MGLIDYYYYAWKPLPSIWWFIEACAFLLLSVATFFFSILMVPFFYPGAVIAIVFLWLFAGFVYKIKKTTGYQYKVFRTKPEHCKRIVERVLNDLDLKFERIEGEKINPLFLWAIYYEFILHVPKEDISVSFVFYKLAQSTAIFIGKVEPSNKELIKRIEDGIDIGTSPLYL